MSETSSYELAVFTRKVRQASRQCLYFLYLVGAGGRRPAAAQDERQFRATLGDRVLDAFGWNVTHEASLAYRTFALDQMKAFVNVIQAPTHHADHPVVKRWLDLRAALTEDRPLTHESADALTLSVQELLDVSAPGGGSEAFNMLVRKVLITLLRNLTLLVAAGAVWAVFFKVEAIRSLVWNRAQWLGEGGVFRAAQAWFPFLAVGGSVLLMALAAPRRRARVGKRAFWAFRYQALAPEPGIDRWPRGSRAIQEAIFGRQLLKLVIGVVVLVIEAYLLPLFCEPTTVTIFLLSGLCLVVLVLAHGLDYWDFIDNLPIRFVTLATIITLLGFASESALYRFVVVAGLAGLALRNARNRMKRTPHHRSALFLAVIFGAASVVVGANLVSATVGFLAVMTGVALWRVYLLLQPGGRNALNVCVAALSIIIAIYPVTSEIEERRAVWHENRVNTVPRLAADQWPFPGNEPVVVVAAAGGGSRAAIYTAYALERLHRELPDVARELQAISSVSGGSLASAAYVSRRYNWEKRFPDWVKALPEAIEAGELVRAVSGDFLLPTLKGALLPGKSRGDMIEQTWRDGPALLRAHTSGTPTADIRRDDHDEDLYISDLTLAWRDALAAHAAAPPFPMPLFNTCSLDQHDVVLSPLPAELYTRYDGSAARRLMDLAHLDGKSDWLTWVADRDAIYGLDRMLPKYDPSLPKAVRASANFPFGFPLVALNTSSEPVYHADPKVGPRATMKLTDGGVLSNSGMWSLFPLLANADKLDELKRRGVLLLVVEASKMPEYSADRRDLTTLYGDINNRNPVSQSLHRHMLEELRDRLGGAFAAIQLDVLPRAGRKSANVLTTWALDDESQKSLRDSFVVAWQREKSRISRAWDCLRKAGAPEKAACLKKPTPGDDDLLSLRPPLD
jgi:hypothetical protein